MKKIIRMALLFTLVLSITGCGTGIKYCSVTGCPKEALIGGKYCAEHKCYNPSCPNQAIKSYSYCEECLDKALNK
ncbi:MAG: hypothetical protein ACI3XA_09715 [Clostridia bacterium]